MADRVANIDVGGGAFMAVPVGDWPWQLRYTRQEPKRPPCVCDDRMLAAGICESYLYLIQECTKQEAWCHIKIMRDALSENKPVT